MQNLYNWCRSPSLRKIQNTNTESVQHHEHIVRPLAGWGGARNVRPYIHFPASVLQVILQLQQESF